MKVQNLSVTNTILLSGFTGMFFKRRTKFSSWSVNAFRIKGFL